MTLAALAGKNEHRDIRKGDSMKKPYEAPTITSEKVGETLSAGCSIVSLDVGGCDPDFSTVLASFGA